MFKKKRYNGIRNLTVWRVLRKRLHLKKCKLAIVCTPLSVNVFVTLATQQHLQYHCKTFFETPCIIIESHIEP
jgi:hypothetical protein